MQKQNFKIQNWDFFFFNLVALQLGSTVSDVAKLLCAISRERPIVTLDESSRAHSNYQKQRNHFPCIIRSKIGIGFCLPGSLAGQISHWSVLFSLIIDHSAVFISPCQKGLAYYLRLQAIRTLSKPVFINHCFNS